MGKVVGGGPRLNHLTFADDVVTIAESVVGLQHLCGLGGARKAPAETDKYDACGVCRLILPTVRGKSQHDRLVHPEWYHGTRTT